MNTAFEFGPPPHRLSSGDRGVYPQASAVAAEHSFSARFVDPVEDGVDSVVRASGRHVQPIAVYGACGAEMVRVMPAHSIVGDAEVLAKVRGMLDALAAGLQR